MGAPIERPTAKELCLIEATSTKQLLQANDCKWDYPDVEKKKNRPCSPTLACAAGDETGPKYMLCLSGTQGRSGALAKEDIEGLYQQLVAFCNNDNNHRARCSYSPEKADGTPLDNVSEEYCRVRTKKIEATGTQP